MSLFLSRAGTSEHTKPLQTAHRQSCSGSLLESSYIHSGHRHRRYPPCPGPSWATSTISMGSASQQASTWHQLHQTAKRLLTMLVWQAYRHQSPLTRSNMKARQANSGHNSRAWVPQTHVLAHSYCMYLSEICANMVSTSPLPPYLDKPLIF